MCHILLLVLRLVFKVPLSSEYGTYMCRIRSTAAGHENRPPVSGLVFEVPLSSEYGNYKTVKAKFWPWLPGKRCFKSFPLRSEVVLQIVAGRLIGQVQGYLAHKETPPPRTLQ